MSEGLLNSIIIEPESPAPADNFHRGFDPSGSESREEEINRVGARAYFSSLYDSGPPTADECLDYAVHYQEIRPEAWSWPHFSPAEMRCRGSGLVCVSPRLMDFLDQLRAEMGGRAMRITSGYRSPGYNSTRRGAARNSYHMRGVAVDISVHGFSPTRMIAAARSLGALGVGEYPVSGFAHFDVELRPGPVAWQRPRGRGFPDEPDEGDEYAVPDPDGRLLAEETRQANNAAIVASGGAGAAATASAAVSVSETVDLASFAPFVTLPIGGLLALVLGYMVYLKWDRIAALWRRDDA